MLLEYRKIPILQGDVNGFETGALLFTPFEALSRNDKYDWDYRLEFLKSFESQI